MSNKDTEQKYFVGNFVRHKTEGWTGVIYAVAIDDWDGVQTILYSIALFGDPEEEVGDEHYGLYWEPEIPELFDIIPYPWQEFFKVGDKVKIKNNKEGVIIELGNWGRCNDNFPIIVQCSDDLNCTNHSNHWCPPHLLIKVGEP